jgi:hypothetical protein
VTVPGSWGQGVGQAGDGTGPEGMLLAGQVGRLQASVRRAREGTIALAFARHVLTSGIRPDRDPSDQADHDQGDGDLGDLAFEDRMLDHLLGTPPGGGSSRAADSGVKGSRAWERPLPAQIASAGYATLLARHQPPLGAEAVADLRQLSRIDPFGPERHSFVFEPELLVGVCAAVGGVGHPQHQGIDGDVWDAREWLTGVLTDSRADTGAPFLALARGYGLHLLGGQVVPLPRVNELDDVAELGFAVWLLARGAGQLPDRRDTHQLLALRFVQRLLTTDVERLSTGRAALVLAAVWAVTRAGARGLIARADSVSVILSSFPACMRRWRWDTEDPKRPARRLVQWSIDSEREVQDILWVMLRPHFPDLEDEDPLPKLGHSSYRPDFSIPSLRLLIEVKYVRQASGFRDVEAEVMVDSVAYLSKTDQYDKIVVFVYDDSASVERHDITRRALLGVPGIADVIIVSRPGRMPPRDHRVTLTG